METNATVFPKIQAIKHVREIIGSSFGLKECKDAVEAAMDRSLEFDTVVRDAVCSLTYISKMIDYQHLYESLRHAIFLGDPDRVKELLDLVKTLESEERARVEGQIEDYRDQLRDKIKVAIDSVSDLLLPGEIGRVIHSFYPLER